MYNIDFKNSKKGYIFGFIFFIIGLIITICFLFVSITTMNKKGKFDSSVRSTKIEYTVKKNDEGTTMYSPVYHFKVDGINYTCKSGYSSSSKSSKSDGLVYYNKNNPNDCMTQYDSKSSNMFFIFSFIPLIFVIIGIVMMLKVRKKINRIKYLSQNGTLIKNLPYTLENTNISVNGRNLQAIAVNYTLPNGTTVHLVGEARYDYKTSDEDQLVDLLIDLNDPTNYFIDFNIDPKY